jgi:hypothetical protein
MIETMESISIPTHSRQRFSFFFDLRRRNPASTRSKKPPSLTKLLKKRDFESITEQLNNPASDTGRWFDAEYSILGENCLHIILRDRPPAKLVELILKRLVEYGIPEPELSVDVLGRTPLHHAVAFLCDPSVIRVLLSGPAGRLSVRAQDDEGRLPLHVAMLPYELEASKKEKERKKKLGHLDSSEVGILMKTTTELLVTVCPQTTLITDYKQRTPLQYAQALESDDFYGAFMPIISQDLRMAEEISKSELQSNECSGMFIEIPSAELSLEDDDVSLL